MRRALAGGLRAPLLVVLAVRSSEVDVEAEQPWKAWLERGDVQRLDIGPWRPHTATRALLCAACARDSATGHGFKVTLSRAEEDDYERGPGGRGGRRKGGREEGVHSASCLQARAQPCARAHTGPGVSAHMRMRRPAR